MISYITPLYLRNCGKEYRVKFADGGGNEYPETLLSPTDHYGIAVSNGDNIEINGHRYRVNLVNHDEIELVLLADPIVAELVAALEDCTTVLGEMVIDLCSEGDGAAESAIDAARAAIARAKGAE